MADKEFPVISGKETHYPRQAVCPECDQKVFEPHSFAILSACTLKGDGKGNASMCDNNYILDLELTWHGAHTDMQGEGIYPDTSAHVPIVEAVQGGQCELYFCSPACLRVFLNRAVDELVKRIEKKG